MIKIVKSLAIILGVVAIAGGGTYAWQQQTGTVSGVTFSAGSQDLKIDDNLASGAQHWVDNFAAPTGFHLSNLTPGYQDSVIVNVKNEGDVNGTASIRLNLTANAENGVISPEIEAGDNTANGNMDGDLAQNIRVKISYKQEGESTFVEKYDYTLAEYGANPSLLSLGAIAHGVVSDTDQAGVGNVKLEWSIPTNASNRIMTDSVGVDVVFGLE
jgi:hypothetical protein